ncbi:hypothetical protein BaRGS_00013471 [Batillaria attramentaria]|uniref:Uncharacterized protein n=1 Tax=Batillaria attramentaria TaxID=370345 RepID=A0ABD0L7G9_9CAEN
MSKHGDDLIVRPETQPALVHRSSLPRTTASLPGPPTNCRLVSFTQDHHQTVHWSASHRTTIKLYTGQLHTGPPSTCTLVSFTQGHQQTVHWSASHRTTIKLYTGQLHTGPPSNCTLVSFTQDHHQTVHWSASHRATNKLYTGQLHTGPPSNCTLVSFTKHHHQTVVYTGQLHTGPPTNCRHYICASCVPAGVLHHVIFRRSITWSLPFTCDCPFVMLTVLFFLFLPSLEGAYGACELGDDIIKMTSWSGSVSSPGQARGMYPSDQTCVWEITVSKGSRVNLTFDTFHLEEGYFQNTAPQKDQPKVCPGDVVKITDEDTVLFSSCGEDGAGQTFISSGNFMSITFVSDEATEKSGFTATYQGLCEKNVTVNDTLESPGFPESPPVGVTCTWTVTSQLGAIIYVRPEEATRQDPLPDCSESPVRWETVNEGQGERRKEKPLCRNDSAIVTRSDVILTYDPQSSGVPWIGQLKAEFTTSNNCSQFCHNTDDCLAPRTMDVGDYRCLCPPQYSGFNCEIYTDPCTHNDCSGVGQCITSSDGQSGTCQCESQYTGSTCETRIDPCVNFTCLNGGRCVSEGVDKARCECREGFLLPDCRTPPNPCLSAPCQNGATCTARGQRDFVCTCSSDYTGARCTIQAGNAERNCMRDDQSPTGGLWRRPDLSECISPLLLQLSRDSKALREAGVEEEVLYNISRRLANVTSVLKGGGNPNATLYPGDLLIASDILSDISVGVVNARTLGDDTSQRHMVHSLNTRHMAHRLNTRHIAHRLNTRHMAHRLNTRHMARRLNTRHMAHRFSTRHMDFTSSVDHILYPTTLDVWKNARVQLVESKVTSLLTSSQSFSSSMVKRHLGPVAMSQERQPSASPISVSFRAAGDYVDLLVIEWTDNGGNDSLSPAFKTSPGQGDSTLTLPRDLLTIARADGSNRSVRLYTGRFTSVAPLLSLKEYRYTRNNDMNITKIVNSDVISAEVLGLPKTAFSRLVHPVRLTFRLTAFCQTRLVTFRLTVGILPNTPGFVPTQDPKTRPELKKLCVFMNMTTSDREQRWLDDGCFTETFNESHVTCLCYHLTNFAVLLDVFDNTAEFDAANSAALSYISYIGGSLSILACLVVVIVFQYFRLSSDRVRIHEQLAVSIIAVQILFLIGVGRTAADDNTPVGLHIYVLLVKVFKRGSHLKKYCAIGWGVPFIVVGISVGVFYDKYGDGDLCWLNHELLLVCFVPTVCLVIIINTVILILVLRVMLRSLHSTAKANTENQSSIRMSLKASAVLLPLLGLTWTLGFLAVDTDGSKVHNAYERRYRQRKRAMSSVENTTRKSSEVSTYLTDGSPTGKSTTKTTLSDMSVLHRRSTVPHGRLLLFDGHHHNPYDPTHPTFDPTQPVTFDSTHSEFDHGLPAFSTGRDVSFDANTATFDDIQASDTDRIWRRSSLGHESSLPSLPPSFTLQRSASSPITNMAAVSQSQDAILSPDLALFVDSMHDVLDGPSRTSVHFT